MAQPQSLSLLNQSFKLERVLLDLALLLKARLQNVCERGG